MTADGRFARNEMRFFALALAVCVAILGGITGFNAVVDPFGMFRLVELPAINGHRPAIYNRVRLMKAYDVRRIKPEVIVLGTSRSHLGIRMSHPGFGAAATRRYNLAFDGATTREMYHYLRHAQAVNPLRQVILGLDTYHLIPVPATTRPDFDPGLLLADNSALSRLVLRLQDAKLLASIQTFREGWATIAAQSPYVAEWYAPDGQRLGEVYFRRPGESFVEHGPRYYFDEIDKLEVGFQLEWRIPQKVAGKTGFLPEVSAAPADTSLDYIRKIVAFCRDHEIDLRIFITPAHAHQLEITAATGGWDSVERGKRALVALLEEDASLHPGRPPIPVWDFFGYSSVTTEPLPPPGSHAEMAFYWDSSHVKERVGDWVLDRLLNTHRPDSPVPSDFGVRLSAGNVEDAIDEVRRARSIYRQAHGGETSQLREWVDAFIRENGIDYAAVAANRR